MTWNGFFIGSGLLLASVALLLLYVTIGQALRDGTVDFGRGNGVTIRRNQNPGGFWGALVFNCWVYVIMLLMGALLLAAGMIK